MSRSQFRASSWTYMLGASPSKNIFGVSVATNMFWAPSSCEALDTTSCRGAGDGQAIREACLQSLSRRLPVHYSQQYTKLYKVCNIYYLYKKKHVTKIILLNLRCLTIWNFEISIFGFFGNIFVPAYVWPHRGGRSTPRAPKELFIFVKVIWSRNLCFCLKDFHHILHARNCDHFRWFPHTPMPP